MLTILITTGIVASNHGDWKLIFRDIFEDLNFRGLNTQGWTKSSNIFIF